MKKNYIKPMLRVRTVEAEYILAASLNVYDENYEDSNNLILNSKGIGLNLWDEDEGSY